MKKPTAHKTRKNSTQKNNLLIIQCIEKCKLNEEQKDKTKKIGRCVKKCKLTKRFKHLNISDYKKIFEFYNLPIPLSKHKMKEQAEKILSLKLCRCIKKLGIEHESRSIGICTKTIFGRKGLNRGRFTCTGTRTVSVLVKK